MVDQRLVDYVEKYRDQYSTQQIRDALLDQGYARWEVDRAIEEAGSGQEVGKNQSRSPDRGRQSRGSDSGGGFLQVIGWILVVLVLLGIVAGGAYMAFPGSGGSSGTGNNNATEKNAPQTDTSSTNTRKQIGSLYDSYCTYLQQEDVDGIMQISTFEAGETGREDLRKFLSGYFESIDIQECSINVQTVEVDGDTATADVEMDATVDTQAGTFSGEPQQMEHELVKKDGEWKISSSSATLGGGGLGGSQNTGSSEEDSDSTDDEDISGPPSLPE